VHSARCSARPGASRCRCLERRLAQVPVEDRIDVLEHVGVHLEELALVLDRDQRALAPLSMATCSGSVSERTA
jgi:hypothetical protein